jgi:ATP-dependent helicase/nuclease subunit A
MSELARTRAEAQQRRASDPAVSAFVAASAGSGKTKLLTDRLLRLMLAGAAPGRILCLAYTKAAAAEMALRLQTRLGSWVTLPDAALAAELQRLDVPPAPSTLAAARALFAQVLDLPGGMRIGTIHAFCQSLLRRFPLEAQLSPHFEVVEETDAMLARRAAQETVLGAASQHVDGIARLRALVGLVSLSGFEKLVAGLLGSADKLSAALADGPEALRARLRAALGAAADEESRLGAAVAWPADAALREALRAIARDGAPAAAERARRMLAWLGLPPEARRENWARWQAEFLNNGEQRGLGSFPNPKLAERQPELRELLLAEQDRVAAIEDARAAALTADISAALAALAAPIVKGYARTKETQGRLDYDDLVDRAARLLVDPGAAWVLYKLDGGLDHLLLDEVQDTAPEQWDIARAITAEFFAGDGARENAGRTVFAVGDIKQSIFAFQGARPEAFRDGEAGFRRQVEAGGGQWESVALDVSFRSTTPVLDLVDAVFADPEAAAGVAPPGTLNHVTDRAGHAGQVELWPLVPAPDPAEPAPWAVPETNLQAASGPLRLAEALADWIAEQTGGNVMLESRGRPLHAGDVLVLVRRRNRLGRALLRALKARGVAVAGLDRLALVEQPAVADLLALADTLLLPQDDLSLAAVLTSPLGGLSPQSLEDLAAPREGRLWDALRARHAERGDWRDAWQFLAALFARVDHVAPYDLLAEALGALGGRARLLARLGPEAEEPVAELLSAALAFAAVHPPSLQGFVQWVRASAAEVKREPEAAGHAVRIMTVHGAKGLQAPLVILPDTTALPPNEDRVVWTKTVPPLPVWVPHQDYGCAAATELQAEARRQRAEEHNRLLYVALTRAEDRLVVCGWENRTEKPETCWYSLVARGFARLATAAAPLPVRRDPWPGELRVLAAPQTRAPEPAATVAAVSTPALPEWVRRPPPPEPPLPQPLVPSRPPGAEFGSRPGAAMALSVRDFSGARFRRGRLIHALLQHLPTVDPRDRPDAMRRYLASPGHLLAPGEAAEIVAGVQAVLDHPDLAPLFGPHGRAEVPLTGVVAGRFVGGLVDRLVVLPGGVMVADFKSQRAPPAGVADVPAFYLQQMAAYRAVLQVIYADRPVECVLVWTATGAVMPLPASALDRYAPGAAEAA